PAAAEVAAPVGSAVLAGSSQSASQSDFRPRRGRARREFRRLRISCCPPGTEVLETPARRRDAHHRRRLTPRYWLSSSKSLFVNGQSPEGRACSTPTGSGPTCIRLRPRGPLENRYGSGAGFGAAVIFSSSLS